MGRAGIRVAGSLVLLSLAGCFWPAPGAGPGRTAHNPFENQITPATVGDLEPLWTATTDGGRVRAPVVSTRAGHVADSEGLYAFDLRDGQRLWNRPAEIPGISFMGQPVVDGDRLLVGSGFPNLGGQWTTEALDTATGTVLATVGSGLVDGLRGSTLLLGSYGFGSGTPAVTSINVFDLRVPGSGWTANIGIYDSGPLPPPMTLGSTRAYQAGVGPNLPTGQQANGVRAYPVAPPPPACPPPAPSSFACPQWSTLLDGTTATSPVLSADETLVYVATDAGTVYTVAAATGAVVWSTSVGAAVLDSPALAEGALFVPTGDGDLVALNAATGAPLWTGSTGSPIEVQPAVAGGVVFTGSADGSLHAFRAAGCGAPSCDALWSASTGTAAVTGAPAVDRGRLYVGTADGRLLAYGLPGGS